ncbi:MAG: CocE/NonD family hydrolase [Polyangiales bacterium]
MKSRDADPQIRTPRPATYEGFTRRSRFLSMRDGTRIAIDVCLPVGAKGKLPTIIRSTRYFRRFRIARGLREVVTPEALDPLSGPLRKLFTGQGYAWVDVDARGSGASFGFRPCPWWLDGEVRDGAEIVDWICRQSWSNGLVGSTGISYDGTTAEFLAFHRHPAVRAVAPRFSLFDAYRDIAFPGGVHLSWFTENWARANAALDRNEPQAFISTVLGLRASGKVSEALAHPLSQLALQAVLGGALAGVPPVDEDRDDVLLRAAVASHGKNFSVHSGALGMTFRDDEPPNSPVPDGRIDRFSPHHYVREMQQSGTAFLSQSGWFDGAYPRSAIERHRALGGELQIGPWVHGGLLDLDPDAPARPAAFDHGAELLRFFDRHLRQDRGVETPPVRYFLMGEGKWKASSSFPPPHARTREFSLGTAMVTHAVDARAGTGRRTRWETLLSPFVEADGPRIADTSWRYESAPLEADLEVTGSPVLVLTMSSTPADAAVFVYLSEVTRDGRVRTVTEGSLRTLHKTRLIEANVPRVEASYLSRDALPLEDGRMTTHAIELLPTAFRFKKGSKLRLSLAGADVDHFRTPEGPHVFRIDCSQSRLLVPYV